MVTRSATDEILDHLRDDNGVGRNEAIRRVQQWDSRFGQSQFWRIQNGKAHWTLDRFVFVAAALGLDPAMLLDRILRGHDIMAQLRARDGPDGTSAHELEDPSSPDPESAP